MSAPFSQNHAETKSAKRGEASIMTKPYQLLVKELKRLRWLSQNNPLFTSGPAYILMLIGCVPVVIFFISMALLEPVAYGRSAVSIGLEALWSLFILSPIYGLLVAAYLTLTANWHLFVIWACDLRARMADRKRSVTTSFRLVRKRLGWAGSEGFFLTMAPKQRFPDSPASKITYADDRHVTMIAGSRAGKGRSFIIPNLAHHKGSVIAYDPSGELVKETAEYREKVLGQKVIVLDPFGLTDRPSASWNPMAEIDFDHDPFAIDQCQLLAESIHHEKSPDPFWQHAPRKMLASTIAFVGTRSILENCHLGMVRDLLMSSDPAALWVAMSQCDAFGGVVRRFGESNAHRHIEELNSTMELSRTAMKWLDSPVMEQFIKNSSFSMKQLKQEPTTLYVVMPAAHAETYKAWIRMLFNAAFDVMQDQSIPKPARDVLFLLDEFPLLGTMERIKRAAGEAAKFGVKLFICAQDITQLKEHYGQAWETFIANSGLLIMFANGDLETQDYLSKRLGKEYYTKYSYTKGKRHSSYTESQELRDVARTDQVEKQVSRQSGDAFFFIPGMKPMQLPRVNYDRWDMLAIPEHMKEVERHDQLRKAMAKPFVLPKTTLAAEAAE